MIRSDGIFFSVVIPTYERPSDLKVCLEALSLGKQIQSPKYEVIVSDDSKSLSSKSLIEKSFPDVTWVKGKQIGPAANRNKGVEYARGEWIVFLDDDCIPGEQYLKKYAEAINENPNISVFEGRIFPNRRRLTWAEGCPENETGGMLWTSNLCVKRKLFNFMDGLDESFKVAYEDVDFSYRLKQAGVSVRFVYEASVCHPWRTLKKEGKNWKRSGYEIESLKIFLKKHGINEITNPTLHLRYLFRMLTMDQIRSITQFRGRGYSILINQIYTTIQSIFIILMFKFMKCGR